MFELLFDRRHRVLLARFSGTLDGAAVAALDDAAARFVEREGPVSSIADFSNVETVGMVTDTIVNRGLLPPIMKDQLRVFVVPRDDLYGLARMFATYQRASGNREPVLVRSLDQAYTTLGLVDPDFQPVEPSQ